MHDEHHGCGCGEGHMHHHMEMDWPMKKEFKLAMLDKKEKVLRAELEFVGKMKELIAKALDQKSKK